MHSRLQRLTGGLHARLERHDMHGNIQPSNLLPSSGPLTAFEQKPATKTCCERRQGGREAAAGCRAHIGAEPEVSLSLGKLQTAASPLISREALSYTRAACAAQTSSALCAFSSAVIHIPAADVKQGEVWCVKHTAARDMHMSSPRIRYRKIFIKKISGTA